MRFVKSVSGEFFHQIEDFHRQLTIDAIFLRPFLEHSALLSHFFWLFLTHCTAQHVCPTQGVTRQYLRDLHHLLLIEDDAVGRF
ncbi:Uncharacterised protein [Vibrio cholerae]|nr:Uncharacterised protein [Vibrio cholerae]